MNESLNPYESPQELSQPDPAFERRTIVGRFEVDALTQRDAARGYQVRHALWLAATLFALPVCISLVYLSTTALWWSIVAGFFVGAVVTILLHIALDWVIFYRNLRLLRQHPIVGALGKWQVRIDEESITVTTPTGQQSWNLRDLRRMELNQRPIVLWLERDLAIALPKHGDYQDDDYASMRKTLRHRIRHVGDPFWR